MYWKKEILPTYYNNHSKWLAIMKNGIKEVVPFFDSDRMADDYYRKLYGVEVREMVDG